MQTASATSPRTTRFRLHHWADEAWDAVADACDGARDSIDFEQYILDDDTAGNGILDVLARKARQGVRVRVLLDAFGSSGARKAPACGRLCDAGGAVRFYNRPRALVGLPPRVHRNHRKTVIIDRRTLFVGGVCFQERMRSWRDTMVRLDDGIAAAATGPFAESWHRAGGEAVPPDDARIYGHQTGAFRYVVNSAGSPISRDLQDDLLDHFRQARHVVRLETPYLVPDGSLHHGLMGLLARGVRLHILLPALSDPRPIDPLNRRYAAAYQRRGADVGYYQGPLLHAKAAIVDDTWASVSSLNLDRLSGRLNLENAVTSTDPAFVQAMTGQFEDDARCSTGEPPKSAVDLALWSLRLPFMT